MALANDIRDVAARCHATLDTSHDYFVHTKGIWEFFEKAVDAGQLVIVTNDAASSVVDQHGLVTRSHAYMANYLTTATFQHFVAVFEDFLFDLLRLVARRVSR